MVRGCLAPTLAWGAVLPHKLNREREREREREIIFIKINLNNDTIIIQCMDYTD